MIILALVLLLATAGPASAGPAASPAAVATSTGTTQTVEGIYTGDRVRDPFLPAAMGGARAPRVATKSGGPEAVDIHGMTLRGFMKDAKMDYALFAAEGGGTYLLRGGKLYNERNKLIPNITGIVKLKQKTVVLTTSDNDEMVFRLGEDEKAKEKP